MKTLELFTLFFFVLGALYSPMISGQEQLRYTAVVYRHGDRTPVSSYPTDPWRNQSYWPVKFGQLTNAGKRQQFSMGQWFRQRYTNLVGDKFDPADVYVRSSDVDRTLMSALANLAGFYPPTGGSIWNTNLAWQPIPVHTTPEHEDNVIAMKKPCPAYDRELTAVKNSAEYKKRLSHYRSLMDYISKKTKMNISDYSDISSIYNVLYIEKLYNFELPEWTDMIFPDQMEEPACYGFRVMTSTPLLARLRVGPFMKELMANMKKTMHYHNAQCPNHDVEYDDLDGTPPKKLNFYSGHDMTVASILNALGLFDDKCPPYTAAVFFELVFDSSVDIHFVKIFYKNTVDLVEPVQLLIPECGYQCPLEHFVKIYKDLVPGDWEKECEAPKFPFDLVVNVSVLVTLFLVMSVWHNIRCGRKTRRERDRNAMQMRRRRRLEMYKRPAVARIEMDNSV